jgi:hypothetical protein
VGGKELPEREEKKEDGEKSKIRPSDCRATLFFPVRQQQKKTHTTFSVTFGTL